MMMNELKNSMHRGEAADEISLPVLPDAMTKLETMPKIPEFIRDKYNSEDYDPLIVSFGPYHHGQSWLKFVEDFKPTAVEWFVQNSEWDETFWLNEVKEVINYLRRSYIKGSTDNYSDDCFARMMLKDVCLVVMITRKPMENDSISKLFDNHLGRAASSGLIRDLYLLENQIPFWFFKRILYKRYGPSEGEKGWRKFWIKANHGILISDDNEGYIGEEDEDSAHFVAALKRTYLAGWKPEINKNKSITDEVMPGRQGGTEEQGRTKSITSDMIISWRGLREKHGYHGYVKDFNKDYYAPRSVTELKAKGIYILPNSNDSYGNITFHDNLLYATIKLPTPEDAEELQNNGVIINMMGNDQDVLDAYNKIYTFRIICTVEFGQVCKSIQEHYSNKARTWLAEFLHTYFRSPWSAITLFASILIILLTLIQAYYAAYPKGDNNKH
ncbi:hypothetical protein LIER_39052 [Lithospermum erythrorhizon]|uniref:Uncharacterized protein n=1 Tax=Lithospermum erythrorhizon TaxID=34254 RepID=A0AAV3QD92_LITER